MSCLNVISRYVRLYRAFMKFSVSRTLEFRVDFYFRVVMDVFYYFVSISFFKILYLHTNQVGGWSEPQAMIFTGAFIVVDAVNMTLFSNNLWMLPQMVNKGDLDYYLVRPVSSFFMLNFREIAFNSFLNLLMAFGFLIYTLIVYPEPIAIERCLLFLILLFAGSWLFQLMRLVFLLPVFWTHGGRGFEMVFWTLEKFAERPHRIFTGALRLALLTVIPFSLMASLPTEVLFTENVWLVFGITMGVSIVLTGVVLWAWRIAIRGYSSASS